MSIEYTYSLGCCKTVWDNGKTYDYENWGRDLSETYCIQCCSCNHSVEAYTNDRFYNFESAELKLVMEFMIEHAEAHQDAKFKFIPYNDAYELEHFGDKGKPLKEFKPIRKISIKERKSDDK